MLNNRLDKLQEMLKMNPSDPFLIYAIALEHMGNRDFETALELFGKLLEENANYLPMYYQIGKLYEAKEDFEKAVEYYEKGEELALKTGDKKTAKELRQAIELI